MNNKSELLKDIEQKEKELAHLKERVLALVEDCLSDDQERQKELERLLRAPLGAYHYFTSEKGEVRKSIDNYTSIDDRYFNIMNYSKTREFEKKQALRCTVLRTMYALQEAMGKGKYATILYEGDLKIESLAGFKEGFPRYKSREDAEKVVWLIGKDKILEAFG